MITRIAADSSIIVKWFKKGEEFEEEALRLRDDVLLGAIELVISEWVYLEVIRGLVKANFPKSRVAEAYSILKEMARLGFMEVVPVSRVLDKAVELEVQLKLYASDAVNLATALLYSVDLLSEDRHLLRDSVRNFMKRLGLRVLQLKDFYKE